MSIETTLDHPAPSLRAEALRGLCGGAVHLPGDPGYGNARMPWNVAVDQRPAAPGHAAAAWTLTRGPPGRPEPAALETGSRFGSPPSPHQERLVTSSPRVALRPIRP